MVFIGKLPVVCEGPTSAYYSYQYCKDFSDSTLLSRSEELLNKVTRYFIGI